MHSNTTNKSERWLLFLSIHSIFFYIQDRVIAGACPSMQRVKGNKHPGQDTNLSRGLTLNIIPTTTPSPHPLHLHLHTCMKDAPYWGLSRTSFWRTCWICLESAYHFSYLFPASVTSCEVTLYIESHGHKNSFKHITASNLVFPIHLSCSVWTVGGNAQKYWQASCGAVQEIWLLKELWSKRALKKKKLYLKDLQYY